MRKVTLIPIVLLSIAVVGWAAYPHGRAANADATGSDCAVADCGKCSCDGQGCDRGNCHEGNSDCRGECPDCGTFADGDGDGSCDKVDTCERHASDGCAGCKPSDCACGGHSTSSRKPCWMP
ncbi:MAG: hypothetical protein JXQ73_03895 [Phycisphaerae bacterium]|nr:hypothetical protein [Phycisphaerae bacterium]